MKTTNLNYLYIFFIVIIFNPKQLSGQDLARDSLLIYHEVIVRIGEHGSFDPYYAFTKDLEKKNHPIYKRFFALYHETLIEKARNQQNPNFVHNRENIYPRILGYYYDIYEYHSDIIYHKFKNEIIHIGGIPKNPINVGALSLLYAMDDIIAIYNQ